MLPQHGQLPIDRVRDLLGIARAMYAAERKRNPGSWRVQRIAAAGKAFSTALELAAGSAPNTMGHRASWMHAQRGIELLSECIDLTMALGPVLEAAGARVRARSR